MMEENNEFDRIKCCSTYEKKILKIAKENEVPPRAFLRRRGLRLMHRSISSFPLRRASRLIRPGYRQIAVLSSTMACPIHGI